MSGNKLQSQFDAATREALTALLYFNWEHAKLKRLFARIDGYQQQRLRSLVIPDWSWFDSRYAKS